MLSFMCMIRAIDTCFCAQLYDAKSQDFPGLFSNRSATPIFFYASYHPPTTYPALRESCDFFISASHKTAICYIRTVLTPSDGCSLLRLLRFKTMRLRFAM